MIMTLTTFVGLGFFLLLAWSRQFLSYLEQKPQVIAFFKDTVTSEEQVLAIREELEATGKTAAVRFVSKEEALRIYRQRHQDDPLLLELVTANTLPSSLEVAARNVADLPELYEIIKKAPDLEDVAYQKDIVDSLIGGLDKGRKLGVAAVLFLSLTSLFTILTVIGMKIAIRKEQIEVERLVGASSWFIRAPFLLEGLVYGVLGGVFSGSILYGLILLFTPGLAPFFTGVGILPVSPWFMLVVLAITVLISGLVGVSGSFLAVWRYLRE